MSPVWWIARRELAELWRDGRLALAGGLMGLLLATALAVGWQQQRSIEGERQAAQRLDYDDWLKQDRRHPHDAAHQGLHAFKPTPAAALVDPGITPYVGSTLWLQAHRQSELRFRPAQDATGLQRFGSLSVAWVLQVLGPLLVIVLGFNAFAGEREQGTLRQVLSLGVAPRRLLWGKALALGIALALCLLPVLLGAAGAVLAQGGADGAWRLAGMAVGYALYFGIAVLGVLAVSALVPGTRMALVLLLGLWIAGVTLAPRLASDLARDVHPSPSRHAFNASLDHNLSAEYERAWQEQLGTGKRWGAELPLNRWGIALRVDDQAGYGVTDRHFGHLWDSFAQQQRMQEWAGFAVPLLALRAWSMGLAGTDFAAHRHFSVAAETHRRLMQDLISEDLVEHADPLGHQHFTYEAGQDLWAKVPPFDYHAPSAAEALRANLRSLGVLSIVLAAAGLLAAWAVGVRKP
jgi:ABC-2 type transport system permease protein